MAILSEVEEDQTPTNPSPSSETVKPENKEEEAENKDVEAAAAADEKKTEGKRGTFFIYFLCVCLYQHIFYLLLCCLFLVYMLVRL